MQGQFKINRVGEILYKCPRSACVDRDGKQLELERGGQAPHVLGWGDCRQCQTRYVFVGQEPITKGGESEVVE